MREIIIRIPDGYVVKVSIFAIIVIVLSLIFPYYANYLDRVSAETQIVKAQAELQARQILGECK